MDYVDNLKMRNVHRYGKNTITDKSLDWRSISYGGDITFTYSIETGGDPTHLISFLEKMKDPDDDIMIDPKPDEISGDYVFHLKPNEMPNEAGWINWPDFQGRVYKNNGQIMIKENKIVGAEKAMGFNGDPKLALTSIHLKL
jgi:hypothetical protein